MQDAGEGLAPLKLPVGWTFGALAAGALLGWLLAGSRAIGPLLDVAGPIGTLWLHALQMTIVPLVAALLVIGTEKIVETARGGALARRTLAAFLLALAGGTAVVCFAAPAALNLFPIPAAAGSALSVASIVPQEVPGIGDFVTSLVAPNVIAAAAETAMLPLIVFFCALGVALTFIPPAQKASLLTLFLGLANAMLVIVGWVLWLAPLGVFALALGVAARSGGGAIAALGHYIIYVVAMGSVVLIAGYAIAVLRARLGLLRFARAVLPAQAVALSTQSSLASLPAMLAACRTLGVRETSADFVLPLAVAIFRATSPVMNLAVVIYVARLVGVPLPPAVLVVGGLVAIITSIGTVSLPSAISFVSTIAPIALAMGVPIGPIALLVAVEMLPDLMRTIANVTIDVAVTASVDQAQSKE